MSWKDSLRLPGRTYFAVDVCSQIGTDADEIVQRRVRGLIHEDRDESAERVDDKTSLGGAVDGRASHPLERPFPSDGDDAQEEIEHLEDRYRLHGAVEVLGEKVPEDLGPEEALDGGSDLICAQESASNCRVVVDMEQDREEYVLGTPTGGCREYDETGPVVLDEFPHDSFSTGGPSWRCYRETSGS